MSLYGDGFSPAPSRVIERMSDRARVVQSALDEALAEIGEGLLTEDELRGLTACLPRLAKLAAEMGCVDKPMGLWKREEMMRFLTIAIRGAVPLRVVTATLLTDDGAPPG